jgi:hypothetical protein
MAEVLTEKKRKSVSFSQGAIVVDGDGAVSDKINGDQNAAVDPAVDEVTVCRQEFSAWLMLIQC